MTTATTSCRAYTELAARILISAIFLLSGVGKVMDWSRYDHMMTEKHMPLVPLFLAGAIAFELIGGAALLAGFRTRWAAAALIVFLVPTTLIFHNFWVFEGGKREEQMINFMKNLAILGGLLKFAADGAGRLSVDACCMGTAEANATHPGEPARVMAG